MKAWVYRRPPRRKLGKRVMTVPKAAAPAAPTPVQAVEGGAVQGLGPQLPVLSSFTGAKAMQAITRADAVKDGMVT